MNQLQEQQAGCAGARIPTEYQDTDSQNDNAMLDVVPISSDGSMLDKALALLEAGFSVIPLGGYGETPPAHVISDRFDGDVAKARATWPKTPRIRWKKFQTETATEQEVRTWWTKWPDANIGIATGSLIVVDGDSDDACEWTRNNLTHTPWTVRTGKGSHFYFRANPDVEVRNSADPQSKIDTRGLGGYVVAAGSRHLNGSTYVTHFDQGVGVSALSDLPMLQPSDIAKIKKYQAAARSATHAQGAATSAVGNLVGFDANSFKTAAIGEPVAEGGRNNAAASLVGKYLRDGFSSGNITTLMTEWNEGNQPPLPASELAKVISSVTNTHLRNNPTAQIPQSNPTRTARKVEKETPFPVELLNVPGLVGDVARYINASSRKPQPLLAVGAALTFCGAIMGRKVCTETDLRTNLYIIGVADSGSGKEAGRKAIKRLLNEVGRPHIVGAEDLASDAGLFAAVWREPSCVVMIDEIGRFWQAVTAKNAPQYLKNIAAALLRFFGVADGSMPEKAHADMADKAVRIIEQPNLCLYGTTVPGRLFEGLHVNDIVDGLMPRFLLIHSDDPDPPIQLMNKIPPTELVDGVRAWINRSVNAFPTGANLADLEPNPLPVHASFEAKEVYAAFEIKNRARRAKARGTGTGLDAMWARADEHAAKLGLIVACGRNFENPTIEIDDAQWACDFVEFVFERSIAEMDIHVSENEHEKNLKAVGGYLQKVGDVNKSTLLRKFQYIKKQPMDEILAHFKESEQATVDLGEPTGGKGRRATIVRWLFNS